MNRNSRAIAPNFVENIGGFDKLKIIGLDQSFPKDIDKFYFIKIRKQAIQFSILLLQANQLYEAQEAKDLTKTYFLQTPSITPIHRRCNFFQQPFSFKTSYCTASSFGCDTQHCPHILTPNQRTARIITPFL